MQAGLALTIAIVLTVGSTAAWKIQHERTAHQAVLQGRARISSDAATQTALAAVQGGRVVESELEEEDGRLIYSFDIAGTDGIHDVEIDALTGELLQDELENEDDADDSDERTGVDN